MTIALMKLKNIKFVQNIERHFISLIHLKVKIRRNIVAYINELAAIKESNFTT